MTNQKGFAYAFLIIGLVVALVGALSFVFWQDFIHEQPVANKTEVVKLTEKDDEIDVSPYAGWLTYTTKKEGFSISYPKTWKYENTKTNTSFDSFTLTGPEGFVIDCNIETVPLDGPGNDGKVVYVDEIKNANYGEPLYVIGHYNNEYSNLDKIMVSPTRYEAGYSGYSGPRGFFESKIPEDKNLRPEEGANFVYLQGEFPTYIDAEGNEQSPKHVDFDTNNDLKDARKILGTLRYQ